MPLRDIVDVFIDRQTTVVTRAGFGVPLFVGPTAAFTERVRAYQNIDAVADDFAATDPEYLMAEAAFSQQPSPRQVKIGWKGGGETWTEALQAIVDEDDEWYGLAIDSETAADILEVAAFVEPRTKLYIARSADADILTAADDDVASDLVASAYARTALIYHSQAAAEYPDAAWLGKQLPTDPGSTTWMFKTLAGIPADSLTATQYNFALGKNVNIYTAVGGVNITQRGTVAEPEYIDVIRGVDWLTARITERVYTALVNQPKIPFTNAGIAIIETLLREQLDIAVERDVIAPEPPYTVTVPDVLDVDPIDRAQRILRDVNFSARLAGAIHEVIIRGTVTP
ncbi:DUF3383 family protein [Marinibaculum pumilum]|uniref:DUF3383 family protein n=1 Tax=Marinibaculum pumilum TaxID=1766165 RepID=A0ABV7KYB4_9PROT